MPDPYIYIVRSFEVHDADTLKAELDLGFDLRFNTNVRINGIDAPEQSTDAGKQVTLIVATALKKIVSQKLALLVVSHDWDKYGGRIVGDLVFGAERTSLASRLLALKLALPFTGKVKKSPWSASALKFIATADVNRYASEIVAG